MSLARKFKTDKACETEGIWLDYGEGVRVKIARAGGANKLFQREADRVFRRYRRQLELGILPPDVQQRVVAEAYARAVVLDWEGVTARDCGGEGDDPVAFSPESAVKLFENLPDFFTDLQRMAQNTQLFLETIREDDAKN